MTFSAIAVPSSVIRSASHLGTLPPCNGRLAVPERCIPRSYAQQVTIPGLPQRKWQKSQVAAKLPDFVSYRYYLIFT